MNPLINNHLRKILCCPNCRGQLTFDEDVIVCTRCSKYYEVIDSIPRLFIPYVLDSENNNKDVTNTIKEFYESNPFPSYDEFDNVGSLIEKARRGIFARMLDDQIPYGARILECGCGTGQLTNFLSVSNRLVIGTDITINPLKMGQEFKEQNTLDRAFFIQMNLFQPCFIPESFNLVIANGVLHHTNDPYLAFRSIATLVKPNGYILIGLYHRYGRLITDIRRFIFRITGDRLKFLDRHTVDPTISKAKRSAWFMDQYKNPHESKHSFREVEAWLNQNGFTFVKSIPKTVLFKEFSESEKLFSPDRFGNWFERMIINIAMIFTGAREGGFFIIIGKKSIKKE